MHFLFKCRPLVSKKYLIDRVFAVLRDHSLNKDKLEKRRPFLLSPEFQNVSWDDALKDFGYRFIGLLKCKCVNPHMQILILITVVCSHSSVPIIVEASMLILRSLLFSPFSAWPLLSGVQALKLIDIFLHIQINASSCDVFIFSLSSLLLCGCLSILHLAERVASFFLQIFAGW